MSSEPVFFWNGPLSNWYQSNFTDENGIKYCNNEQYMMKAKADLFQDKENGDHIMKNTNPKQIKWYGRQVKGFDFKIWEKHAKIIVTHGCYLKFSQNPRLKSYILSTGNRILVEASPYDKLWGIGLREDVAKKTPMEKWPGENWLGECLMKARNLIKLDEEKLKKAKLNP
mgnify:CR=1 FL=1